MRFTKTLVVLVLISIAAGAAPWPSRAANGSTGLDPGQFIRAFSEAESIADRREICAELNAEQAPPYVLLFCEAFHALASGKDSLAVGLLRESLLQEPKFAIGYVAFGDAFKERKDWNNALVWYGRACAIAPNRLDPRYGIGQIWLTRGETEGQPAYEKALEAFRGMTRIDPNSPDGWNNVGMVQAILGRFDEAEASYRRALDLNPKDPQTYFSLGSLGSRRGDDGAAESAWKKALQLQPSLASAATELAALYGRQGRLPEAVGVLEAAVDAAHVGPDAARLRRDLAVLKLIEDQTDAAASLLDEARILNPDAATLAVLGHVRMLEHRIDVALPLFAASDSLNPAIAGPFVHAWADSMRGAMPAFAASDPAGASRLNAVLAKAPEPGAAIGAAATHPLMQSLLPGWKLPEGRIPAAPVKAPEYDTPPVPIYRALASYPDAAAGIEGLIRVRLRIDTAGNVRDAKILEGGNPALERATLDAAVRWRFQPALRNGIPVEADVTIPFHFSSGR